MFKGDDKILPFQSTDSNRVRKQMRRPGSAILGHKTGLGKTFISLHIMEMLQAKRVLILGTNSAVSVWKRLTPHWTDRQVIHISRKSPKEQLWKEAQKGGDGIWVMNVDIFRRLIGPIGKGKQKEMRAALASWDLVIADEAHKYLRSRTTKTFEAMCLLAFDNILILSATLASRGPQDLWPSLHLISPQMFSSFWRFVETFCFVNKGYFGMEIGGVRNPQNLKKFLEGFVVSRTLAEVRPEVKELRRQPITLDMTEEQEKKYLQMDQQMFLTLGNDLLIARNRLSKDMRLRQLALCPRILGADLPLGAGIEYILDELEENPHSVIFSLFKELLFVLQPILVERGYEVEVLVGGTDPDEVNVITKRFKDRKSVCLCSVAFAESFDLSSADMAYCLGASYDPTQNIQMEGRLQRLDSEQKEEGPIIKYIIIADTVEEGVKDIINGKVANVSQFMDTYITSRKQKYQEKINAST